MRNNKPSTKNVLIRNCDIQESIHCIHHIFENQVRKTPTNIALRIGEKIYSYQQLNRLSNRLAHQLTNYVITPNTLIALCLPPSLELLIGVLAILKSGGACFALDLNLSQQHWRQQLKKAGISIVLCQTSVKPQVSTADYTTLCINTDTEETLDINAGSFSIYNNPISPTEPSHLACVVRNPITPLNSKPDFISHHTLTRTIKVQLKQSTYVLSPITLQHNSINSAMFFLELFSCWCGAGILVLMPSHLRYSCTNFWHFIQLHKINRLILHPDRIMKLAQIYRDLSCKTSYNQHSVNSLREIIVSGGHCPINSLIENLLNTLQDCRLIHSEMLV